MRTWPGAVLLVGFVLSSTAVADTYYKYRDKKTGRDVYVNALEQVPRKYRKSAQVVLETSDSPAEQGKEPVIGTIDDKPQTSIVPTRVRNTADTLKQNLRRAVSGKSVLHDVPALVNTMVDHKVVSEGRQSLTPAEREHFSTLFVTVLVASIIAAIAALVAWIVIIVTAIRDDRRWWAFFIFIFSPLGYVYVFLHGGKGRALFKTLCTLGMLSPALVSAIGAWRIYAWFQAVMQSRGLSV